VGGGAVGGAGVTVAVGAVVGVAAADADVEADGATVPVAPVAGCTVTAIVAGSLGVPSAR
jgi:hypothetical protein